MKRIQSVLSVSLLTLSLSATAFAGDITGRSASGDITGRKGDITGRNGDITGLPGDITGIFSWGDITGVVVSIFQNIS
jgi:hypothetical protein